MIKEIVQKKRKLIYFTGNSYRFSLITEQYYYINVLNVASVSYSTKLYKYHSLMSHCHMCNIHQHSQCGISLGSHLTLNNNISTNYQSVQLVTTPFSIKVLPSYLKICGHVDANLRSLIMSPFLRYTALLGYLELAGN